MATYLFDTNALQSLAFRQLRAAREAGHELLASPISTWEFLRHLDEENFRLARDNLLKVAECQILHDPLAEVMADVGCEAAVNPSRFEDQAAVRPLLDTLRTCESYEECRICLVTSNETQRRVGDIAANARMALQATKDRFVRALAGDCRRLIDIYGRAGAMQLGGEAFCREALRLASGLVADARAVGCTVTMAALGERTLIGSGYSIARACQAIRSVGAGQPYSIDENDCEDYELCLHLGCGAGRAFVTSERGVQRAFQQTLAAFRSHWESSAGIPFETAARVIQPSQFLAETQPAAPSPTV
jgi:hypothetical protein